MADREQGRAAPGPPSARGSGATPARRTPVRRPVEPAATIVAGLPTVAEAAARREHWARRLRTWCTDRTLDPSAWGAGAGDAPGSGAQPNSTDDPTSPDDPASRPALGLDAAVCIAAGRLDDEVRSILAARRRAGRAIPEIGDVERLRALADDHARLRRRIGRQRPGLVRSTLEYRGRDLARRLEEARHRMLTSPAHHAQGVRAVRRERRAGIHLEPEQRDALFDALCRTPAPLPVPTGAAASSAAAGAAVGRLRRLARGGPAAGGLDRLADAVEAAAPEAGVYFVDRYDTVLYVAGLAYDRVRRSTAWYADELASGHAQLDLADELVQISLDVVALQGVYDDLTRTARRAGTAHHVFDTRRAALEQVWDQLLDRVAALLRIAEVVEDADRHLGGVRLAREAAAIDERIDRLVARSGARELSTEHVDRVGGQVDVAAHLSAALPVALASDIAALTRRS